MKRIGLLLLLAVLVSGAVWAGDGFEIKLTEVVKHLVQPWSLTFVNDSNILITEKSGNIIQINLATGEKKEIKHNLQILAHNQGGLLDILYHENEIYVSYSEKRDDVENENILGLSSTSIAKAEFKNDHLFFSNIFRAEPPIESGSHFGSRLVIKNNYLYSSIGERGLGMIAQDGSRHPGSIIRIFVDGTIPKDNPRFVDPDKSNWLPEIYIIGVRNPQGLALSSFDNKVYMSNHGAKGGDWFGSADVAGANYGWKILGWGGTNYDLTEIGPKWLPGFAQPLIYWIPSIATSAITIYKGEEFSNWSGTALITSLKDRSLRKLIFNENEVLEEVLVFKGKIGRIRDIKVENRTGKIYLLTDEGSLWLLENKAVKLIGDVNGDGTVNIFDLVIAAGSFGKTGAGIMGDVNADGSVNIFDLVIVAGNFGKSLLAAPAMTAKIELTTDQKHHISSAIDQLESNSSRSSEEEIALSVLKAILPDRLLAQTKLLANYPNPFNPETWIPFQLAENSTVTAKIYDITGKQIRMIELGHIAAGNYVESNRAIYWDGKTETGEQVSSGTYFYQIEAGDYTDTRKMVILK